MFLFQISQCSEKLRIRIVADALMVAGDLNRFYWNSVFLPGDELKILRIQMKSALRVKAQIVTLN